MASACRTSGLLVNPEEREPALVLDAIPALQAFDLGRRNGRNLGFIDIQRGQPLGERARGGQLAIGTHQRLGGRHRRGTPHLIARHAHGLGEAEPQLGMIVLARFLFGKIVEQDLARCQNRRSARESR